MICGHLSDIYRVSRPEELTPLAREIRQAGRERAGRRVSGGSNEKELWELRGRAISFSREVGTYGQVCEGGGS